MATCSYADAGDTIACDIWASEGRFSECGGDWKLLEYYEDHHAELYNLREDLSEKTDLAARQAEKTQQLRDRLHAWLKAVDAQMPVENRLAKSSPLREKRAK